MTFIEVNKLAKINDIIRRADWVDAFMTLSCYRTWVALVGYKRLLTVEDILAEDWVFDFPKLTEDIIIDKIINGYQKFDTEMFRDGVREIKTYLKSLPTEVHYSCSNEHTELFWKLPGTCPVCYCRRKVK